MYSFCYTVYRDEELSPRAVEPVKDHLSPTLDSSFSNSPDPARLGLENPPGG